MTRKIIRKAFLFILVYVLITAAVCADDETRTGDFDSLAFIDFQGYTYRASSTLESQGFPALGTYGMHTIFDGSRYTGWSEGVEGNGTGEVLWIQIDDGTDTLLVRNGFARNAELFDKNNRVRSFDVSLWSAFLPAGMVSEYGPLYAVSPIGNSVTLDLEDSMPLQEFTLPFEYTEARKIRGQLKNSFPEYAEKNDLPPHIEESAFLLRIEITSVYQGSAWDDTCINELRCFDSANFKPFELESMNGALGYRTSSRGWRALYAQEDVLYDPYILSPDGRWCVAFTAPAETEGRVETGYALFHLPYPEIYRHRTFDEALASGKLPLDFELRDGTIHLLFDDGSSINPGGRGK